MKMVGDGEREKMNNEKKYFTYYDALFASAILCVTFFMQLVVFERLEDRVKELEKKVLFDE
jgi:Golgi nucleoside diphosphatase